MQFLIIQKIKCVRCITCPLDEPITLWLSYSHVIQINAKAHSRYHQKFSRHVGNETYTLGKKDSSNKLSDLPGVEAINITNYLVLQTSYYTISQMKVYKGVEVTNIYLSIHLFISLIVLKRWCLVFLTGNQD